MSNNTGSPASSNAPVERFADTTSQFPQLSQSHQAPDVRRAEFILGPTGPFRPFIEEYLATVVPSFYKPNTVVQVRSSIAKFFRFVVRHQHIEELDQIRPSTITRFIEIERERGLKSINFIGHISTFFVWLISQELYDRGNPVISRLHRPKMSPQAGSTFPS
jgi:hypothetical protein